MHARRSEPCEKQRGKLCPYALGMCADTQKQRGAWQSGRRQCVKNKGEMHGSERMASTEAVKNKGVLIATAMAERQKHWSF